MLKRLMYCLYLEEGKEQWLSCPDAENVSLSFFRGMAFLYYETEKDTPPEEVLGGEIRPFPSGELFFRMPDVFHYSAPRDREHWRRLVAGKKPWVRINRLRPDMLARYLYFHYQYQEERPGGGPDRYGVIFLFGEYLVHYLEWPFEPELSPAEGRLTTNATPADDVDEWDRIMSEFFIPWEGHPWPWHEMRTVTPDGGDYLIPCNYDKLVENGEG